MLFVLTVLLLATAVFADNKIVNGDDLTDRSVAPWQASLQRSGSHFCGGSLITPSIIMTACHCDTSGTTVVLGTTELNDRNGVEIGGTFNCHPGYRRFTIDYDYAMIHLSTPAPISTGVIETIELATIDYPSGTEAEISGWGKTTGSGSTLPNQLQFATVTLINQAECSEHWGGLTARMQCAQNRFNSACNGDSGGPLVVRDNGTPKLVGNTSWGASGCTTTVPSAWSKNFAIKDDTWLTNEL